MLPRAIHQAANRLESSPADRLFGLETELMQRFGFTILVSCNLIIALRPS